LSAVEIDISAHVRALRERGEHTVAVLLRATQSGPLVEVAASELRTDVPRLVLL
jgi:hypothetical protein